MQAHSFDRQPSGGQKGGASNKLPVEETRPVGAFNREGCLYL